jgi:uncharacterized protein YjbI with pentapeptide repeats
MTIAEDTTPRVPLGISEEMQNGLDAFVTTVVLSICLHIILTLIGAHRYAAPPPAFQRPPMDAPRVLNAELVPPSPAIGELIKSLAAAKDAPLPPVDKALVKSMIADAGRTLLACRGCTLAGANFNKAYLRLASLQGADMRQAKLSGADLTATQFRGANLEGAVIAKANLAGADLTNANLRGVDLSHSRLDAAIVEGADFTGAKLVGANLRLIEYVKGLKLRDVDATGAIFRYAHLGGVDFSGANLSGADFFRAVGLTTGQLAFACGDELTKLPEGVTISHCAKKPQIEGKP